MKKVVSFGEILLRLSTSRYERFVQATNFEINYGGGEANVAVSLSHFGIPVEYVTQLPLNEIGTAALASLRKNNVGTQHILFGGERLGIYFLETGAMSRASKVIYDRSHSSITEIKPGMIDWKTIFDDAQWFHWSGITPALSQNLAEVCKEAIHIASEMGLTVSTDINLRKNLWNYGQSAREVMPELLEGCDVILGNEEHLVIVLGIKPEVKPLEDDEVSIDNFQSICEQVSKRLPKAKKVILTIRRTISASHNTLSGVIYNGKSIYQAPTHQMTDIVDSVGGGDALMAGLITGLINHPEDDQRTINFALASAVLKHTMHGDYSYATKEEVEKLATGQGSGRITR